MIDTLLLSRMQFALNISFHILFPTITIALCWFLLFFKVQYQRTHHEPWLRAYRFWVKIFALSFALGVVSGITMSFQFGTNWPGFMEVAGNIAGPLLGYEVLTAFFMEATFLGIMLFGMNRVSPRIHTLSILAVAIGTTLSAFWILALNSWMHTPQGFEMRDGVAYPTDWLAIIFNPSLPYRFVHTLLASVLTASFLVAGISAYRILRGDDKEAPRLALKTALTVAVIATPLQIVVGDFHGLNTIEHQPQKIAAMEGIWDTKAGAPLLLFAIPDEEQRENHFEIAVPNLASVILTHDKDGVVQGLNDFADEHPPVKPMFFGFRIMVGMGMLMLLVSVLAFWKINIKGQSGGPTPIWLLRTLTVMTFSGWLATLAGWYVTEIGRQPYLITGILKTSDAVTTLPSSDIATTFALYLAVYCVLLVTYIRTVFRMARKSVYVEEYQKPFTAEAHEKDVTHAAPTHG